STIGECSMKAAVLHEVNKPLQIEEISIQKPGPREVLIRTTVAGLCHSDLHFMEGLYPHPLPVVLGHESAGVVEQAAPRRFLQVLKPIQVKMGESVAELRPYANGFRADVEIDFANPVIGKQNFSLDLNPESFRREVSRARTFGCMSDVAKLLEAGFARGASFENSLVFDETCLLNAEGLRFANECARHKVLDVIGDLALAGLPLLGAYRSVRGGHKLNHAVLTALLADRSAWRVVEGERARRARPAMDAVGGMVGGLVAPAYGPDVS
ncbi:MAG: UDP-3-O-acyl-N-acetylglucosamine deacetylase, partial [Rhizobiales bacterium]|nr:UDP-3-O-acyl-N-acetylglucosamine deacetylase [Hyphomicrobiales bacterium]